mgnify:CR=1 FL=1|jgi:hypothetical protein
MQIFKISFKIKLPEETDEEWRDGFYFIDESIGEVQTYLTELYEEYDVRDLLVVTANIPGWTQIPVEKGNSAS